ncbi:hypothetical protein EYR40_003032 [Pleurotus pulmonarius]|nr:hypothetical protein EYR40_003032 [Pleurotus pulmonarius]
MPPPDQQVEVDFPPSLAEQPEVPVAPVLKHDKYYLDDGDFYARFTILSRTALVTADKGTEIQRTPNFLEQHPPFISQMLRPVTSGQDQHLHFSWVLWLLYNESLVTKPSIEQWSAIHAVVKQYKMDMIGAFATKQMGNTLDLVERVLSIQHFGLQDQWAKATYDLFYQREEPISAEEGERLGFKAWAE